MQRNELIFGKPTKLGISTTHTRNTVGVGAFVDKKIIHKILELTHGLLISIDENDLATADYTTITLFLLQVF